MGKFLLVLIHLDAEKYATQQKREQDVTLRFSRLVRLGGFQREHDGDAGADQHECIERANRLTEMHVVRRRLTAYKKLTEPVMEYYGRTAGEKVLAVDGNRQPDEVTGDLVDRLGALDD